jgi:glycosyltransferase involved in cell wall biosynthesis
LDKRRVLIDGRNLALEAGTGVATYARNLSFALRDLGCRVEVLYGGRGAPGMSGLLREIAFFDTNAGDPPRWLRLLRAARAAATQFIGHGATPIPITGTVIADHFKGRLPYFDGLYNSTDLFSHAHGLFGIFGRMHKVTLHGPRPDLVHWTYPMPLRLSGTPNIYTLHDLVPLRLPHTTLDNKRRYFRLVRKLAASADHIVTVSENSRADIINILGADERRVTNTYQAVDIPTEYSTKSLDIVQREVEGTFGLTFREYFLFWGAIEPKKNVGRIIEAYLASGVKSPLVIVGGQAWKSEQELRLLYDDNIRTLLHVGDETRVKRRVIQLSYVPFRLLVSLIRGARATVFPSLYEGFGLPVLESMLLGTPVISANTSSIPELAGDAAILADPYDTRQISDAIRSLDADEAQRTSLAERGIARAQLFSRQKFCKRLNEIYRSLE